MNFPPAKFACSQMKSGPESFQASKSTSIPNGMKSASAALIASSRNTVSPTAKSPTHHPSANVGADQGMVQLMGRVGVYRHQASY